ncbi:MAG TPA: two-component sensor histidine kinase, partial [Firmicutes bacterium]|nr:two-component sensor histidine kinase [Bacillota bacterium]
QEYLEIIAVESSRLATLATNVLNLSKVENQTILTDQKVYDLSEQIRGAILLLAPKWEEKQLEMAIELPDCSYYGNKDLLGEVWINLLDNAIKFSTVGGKLGVSVFDLGTKLAITISDTGLGMDQETKQQIFNKFYQGDTSRATAGNGVGLAIVDKVVALHGGTITVKSAVGSGSRFEVLLPKRVKPERSMA